MVPIWFQFGSKKFVIAFVDAMHIEADAALRAELAPIGDGDGEMVPEAVAESRPALALAEPRSGPTPKRTASHATAVLRPIWTPSCVTSPGIASSWCIADRSPSIPRRG